MKVNRTMVALGGAAALGIADLIVAHTGSVGTPSCVGRRATAEFDPSQVDRIEIGGETPVVVARGEKSWVVESKWGYPAEASKVREALILMSGLKIGQSAPGMTNDCSKTVRLISGGRVVSELAIGRVREAGGRYVRVGDDVALVNDSLELFDAPGSQWLSPRLSNLRAGLIRGIRFGSSEGEVSLVQTNGAWRVVGMAEDEEMGADKAVQKARAAQMSLSYLNLADVVDPAVDDATCGFTNGVTFAARMQDGVEYTARIGGIAADGGRYFRMSATALPTGTNAVASAEAVSGAEEFNDSKSRWTYVVSEEIAEKMVKSREDFVTKKKGGEKK